MSDSSAQLRLLLTGPALCGLLLAGIAVDNRNMRAEGDFSEFHRRAADAIEGIPLSIGPWVGREQQLSAQELNLLKPNAYKYIQFREADGDTTTGGSRFVLLLVAQCRQARLMEGHYPPNCYPSQGFVLTGSTPRTWNLGRLKVQGVQYFFERRGDDDKLARRAVYNFMVLPGQGVRPDMQSVVASAEDYQQRYYGAAQFQLVFGGSLARATAEAKRQRDDIFAELIGPCSGVIDTLCDGVNPHE